MSKTAAERRWMDRVDPQPEEWRLVPGWEERYEVSSYGRVRSIDRVTTHGRRYKGRLRVPDVNPRNGYHYVNFYSRATGFKRYRVHLLVLAAFVGPRPEGMVARHLNGLKFDNRLCNLSYGTHCQNQEDKRAHGTLLFGDSHPRSKLSAEAVREIRVLARSMSQKEIGERFGVRQTTISNVLLGKCWGHVS